MDFSGVSLSLLSESPILRPIWARYSLLKTIENDRICGQLTPYQSTDKSNLLNRAGYYNKLHLSWPDINFYVIPTPTSTEWCVAKGAYGDNLKKYFIGDQYLSEFSALLNPAIGYTWAFKDSSFNEGISNFYKTDHH